jgi:hypothetical protein
MCPCQLFLQLEDGAVLFFSKTIEDDGLEITTPGNFKPRTMDEYVQAWRNQIWEYGYSRWFRGTRPTRRPRHLRTTGIRTWPSSQSSTGLINLVNRIVVHSSSACVNLSGICVFFIGIS